MELISSTNTGARPAMSTASSKARNRPAGAGADQVRACDQPEDRQGAWPRNPSDPARARRRGDRITALALLHCICRLLASSRTPGACRVMSAPGCEPVVEHVQGLPLLAPQTPQSANFVALQGMDARGVRRASSSSRDRCRSRRASMNRIPRQAHGEDRALAWLARHRHVTPHHPRELAREGKAEPVPP